MARQQDLDIGHLEAERLDRFLNQGNRALKAAVDEDMPLGSGDQIGGQILGTDVVNIADDLVRREWLVPIGLALSNGGHGESQCSEQHGKNLRLIDRLLARYANKSRTNRKSQRAKTGRASRRAAERESRPADRCGRGDRHGPMPVNAQAGMPKSSRFLGLSSKVLDRDCGFDHLQ